MCDRLFCIYYRLGKMFLFSFKKDLILHFERQTIIMCIFIYDVATFFVTRSKCVFIYISSCNPHLCHILQGFFFLFMSHLPRGNKFM